MTGETFCREISETGDIPETGEIVEMDEIPHTGYRVDRLRDRRDRGDTVHRKTIQQR